MEDGLVKVNAGGKEFMVPQNMAEAMTAHNDQFTTQIETLSKSLSDSEALHKQQMADLNTQVSTKIQDMTPVVTTSAEDADAAFFESPTAAMAKMRSELKKEITTEMTETYTQDQSRLSKETKAAELEKEFWVDFYKENTDLKGQELIVQGITARDSEKIKDDPLDKIRTHIADETRKYFLSINPNYKAPTIHTENPSNADLTPEDTPETVKVVTLSDQLRTKQKTRANAKFTLKQA